MNKKKMLGKTTPLDRPQALPWCEYPKAKDVAQHGVQQLPEVLPLIDYPNAQSHRSVQYKVTRAETLEPAQVLQMTRIVATSFAKRDPMFRHLRLPKQAPTGLLEVNHIDPYGTDVFGPWTKQNIFYWLIRLLNLTDPTSPLSNIQANEEVIEHSLAITDSEGGVIGGAFNETMPAVDVEPPFRQNDPFLSAVLSFFEPIFALLGSQDAESMAALRGHYPGFRKAHDDGKVGHHFLIARSDALPTEHTFELVVATAERYQKLGYEYMVTSGVNQWTGAACEVLGGTPVHYAPFQAAKTIPESAEPLEDTVTSSNGYISNKDSGSMFYVIHLD